MPGAGFELAIPGTKRLQTYSLDRAAIGIGFKLGISRFILRVLGLVCVCVCVRVCVCARARV
jgi:hypothetical protein